MNYQEYLKLYPPVRRLRAMWAIDSLIDVRPNYFLGSKEDNYAATRECIIRCYRYLLVNGAFNRKNEMDYKTECHLVLNIIESECPFLAHPEYQAINSALRGEFPRLLKEIHHHLRGEL